MVCKHRGKHEFYLAQKEKQDQPHRDSAMPLRGKQAPARSGGCEQAPAANRQLPSRPAYWAPGPARCRRLPLTLPAGREEQVRKQSHKNWQPIIGKAGSDTGLSEPRQPFPAALWASFSKGSYCQK